MSALVSVLQRMSFAEHRGVTWHDLAEEVAREYDVRVEDVLDVDAILGRTQKVTRARAHFFGALRGAGVGYSAIAALFNLDSTRVRNGVLLAGRRLGIEPMRGSGKRGQWAPAEGGGA